MALSPAQAIVLRDVGRDGLLFAETPDLAFTIQRLVAKGYAEHKHGLIYTLTDEGKKRKAALKTRRTAFKRVERVS